jgi:hypothetical protein
VPNDEPTSRADLARSQPREASRTVTPFHWFATSDPQVARLRAVLMAAALLGMLLSVPLWLATREYPLVPISTSWPALPPVCGPWLLGITLLSLMVAAWFFRAAIILFLCATLYLYCCDENRGQPWIYLYWVMLLLNLLPERIAVAACRVALSAAYIWASIQKLNPAFFRVIPTWFVQPAADLGLPGPPISALRMAVALTPLWELFIGVGLWFAKTRRAAIAVAAIMHLMVLLFLGFQHNNLNLVVWPWNVAMVALLVVLFGSREPVSLPESLRELWTSKFGAAVTGLFAFLPALSFVGGWDSYFSWAVYSANLSRADFYLSQSFRDRLPTKLQAYVHPVENFNPAFQLPFVFEFPRWGAAQMHVPPLPEPRGYEVMFRQMAASTVDPKDCWMIVETRSGRVLLYRVGEMKPAVLKK